MASGNNLVTAPIATTLLAFALPTLAASMLQSANGSIDTIWVGRLLGADAVAATTNGNLVMFLMTAFVFGFGMAATILIGQAFGRGDIETSRRIVGTTVGTFVPVALVLALVGWFLAPDVLALLGTDPAITPLARDFLRVTFVALPAILLMTMLMMALRGSGDAITPLIFMALAVVLDVVLNPVFILGLGPAPRMGIGGSAFAMAVANYIALAAMLLWIYARDLPLRLRGEELAWLRPDMSILALMLRKGLPMGLQMIVVSGSMLAMMRLINHQGVDTTAAFGATQQIWTYVQMPAMALGAAVSAMAAQNIGAGRWDRVDQITRIGVIYNLFLTGALVALLLAADRQAMQIFLASDADAVTIGEHIAWLATWGFIPFGVTMVLFATIRANGQVFWPLVILFVSMFPVRLGFAYGLQGVLGADAIWLSFPAGMIATMMMAVLLYRYGNWRSEQDMQISTSPETRPAAASLYCEAGPPGAIRSGNAPPAV
ncbi:MAG: MATE family efflux transporter [Paracoccus sp. (in: a-proteobacteria)]|uniref:MATE family efflux transporter n=1 Tax=Paracoccus sp. TaxID=267 RepID=UPI0026DFAFCA|nr:MATE family efflux transporter [Paracoccus sp. (in: a-proteobacteria)]MDO5632713.1 MATE family efflux transporter [Paracoccus sp. (in: a-proteobacteria)]